MDWRPNQRQPSPVRSPSPYRAPSPLMSGNNALGLSPTMSSGSQREPSRERGPPSYADSSLDRSPLMNPMMLDDRPRVPPPIYLRSSTTQSPSNKGSLKINVPAWGVALVRPPGQFERHSNENGTATEPPTEDTVLSGYIEVVMKERRRCTSISVGIQSVCNLNMGETRGWESDGIFERGVEVLSGDAEGIWLDKGSQTFSFTLLLPATLATHDYHDHGRLSHILTARVEGIPSSSGILSLFAGKRESQQLAGSRIPFKEDFEAVIARSDKLASDLAAGKRIASPPGSPILLSSDLPSEDSNPGRHGEGGSSPGGSPRLNGLYTRRQSSDMHQQRPNAVDMARSASGHSSVDTDNRSLSIGGGDGRTEKAGWLKGDLCAARFLLVHANPSPTGDVTRLDLRKEGFVDGLGSWRFTAMSDVFSVSAIMGLSISVPNPSPKCTLFFCRLILTQSYSLYSPRTPNDPPHIPEPPSKHLIYQIGTPIRSGNRWPGHDVPALWRGLEAGGKGGPVECGGNGEDGWKIRSVVRMPSHDKIRPTTGEGSVTPIRVSHELLLQLFYSVDGQETSGRPIKGSGELRMMQVRFKVMIPSCCCMLSSLSLPTYDSCSPADSSRIDELFTSPPCKSEICACGATFTDLGEEAFRRLTLSEQDEPCPVQSFKDSPPGRNYSG